MSDARVEGRLAAYARLGEIRAERAAEKAVLQAFINAPTSGGKCADAVLTLAKVILREGILD